MGVRESSLFFHPAAVVLVLVDGVDSPNKNPMKILHIPAPLRRRAAPLAFLFATLSTFAQPAFAQVPAGSAVVGTYVTLGAPNATSGLHLVDLTSGAVTSITGLPPALQVPGGVLGGVGTLALRSGDGGIVVGTTSQTTLEVFVLYLNGNAVDASRTVQIPLCTLTSQGGVYVKPLPDDRIFIVVSDGANPPNNGPMAGHVYGIIDLSGPTPTVTPIPNPPLMPVNGDYGGGIAADPTGRYIYFPVTRNIPSPNRVLELHRIDLTNSTSCVLTSWPGQFAGGAAVDNDGSVYLSATDLSTNPHQHFVHKVQVSGCGAATVTSVQSTTAIAANVIELDRATGNFIADSGYAPGSTTPVGGIYSIDPAGLAILRASFLPNSKGYIARQGIAVCNAIDSYGAPSDGLSRYWFENFPNPGGQAAIGNLSFSLTLRSDPTVPTLSLLAVSRDRASIQVAGIEVLVDPSTAITFALPLTNTQTFAMPIPANPALQGQLLTAQSIHLESTGAFAASAGLAITIQ